MTGLFGTAQCDNVSPSFPYGRHVFVMIDGEWTCQACGETRDDLQAGAERRKKGQRKHG